MLTCVFHPLDGMRVVEDDEAEPLLASGVWFDSPKKAYDYKVMVEREMMEEAEAKKPKAKFKEKGQ